MARQLKAVEALPESRSLQLLPSAGTGDDTAEERAGTPGG
jgi:hypothetical protein